MSAMERNRGRGAGAIIGLVLVSVLAVVVAGAAFAKTATVKARGERWRPLHTYIGNGDRVMWTNPTSRVHDLKAYGAGWTFSKVLDPGESASRKFNGRGTYKYRCVRHSGIVGGKCEGMCGLIHVVS